MLFKNTVDVTCTQRKSNICAVALAQLSVVVPKKEADEKAVMRTFTSIVVVCVLSIQLCLTLGTNWVLTQ